MKKVALTRAEYMASLPPYRFNPGDVIEIDDDWADQLVRRGIASTAKANAKTVQQIRIDARPPVPTPADDRAVRRAALKAELAALNQQDAERYDAPVDEGHYSDTLTRGEPEDPPEDPVASGATAKAGRK